MSTLITPAATIAYVSIFQPRLGPNPKPGQVAEYSCTLLFTPAAMETPEFLKLVTEVKELFISKIGAEKFAALLKDGKLKMPFRQDIASSGFPDIYSSYIRVKSKEAPGVVSKYADPKTGKAATITNPQDLWSGCLVKASVRPYYYDREGNKGVAFGLNNLQVLDNSKSLLRLDNRRSAENEFPAEDPKPVDLADVDVPGQSALGNTRSELSSLLGGM